MAQSLPAHSLGRGARWLHGPQERQDDFQGNQHDDHQFHELRRTVSARSDTMPYTPSIVRSDRSMLFSQLSK